MDEQMDTQTNRGRDGQKDVWIYIEGEINKIYRYIEILKERRVSRGRDELLEGEMNYQTDISVYGGGGGDRYITCISLNISIHLSIHLSLNVPIHLSIHISLNISIYLSIHLSLKITIYLSISLSLHVSILLNIYVPISPSIYPYICLSIPPSNMCNYRYTFIYMSCHSRQIYRNIDGEINGQVFDVLRERRIIYQRRVESLDRYIDVQRERWTFR